MAVMFQPPHYVYIYIYIPEGPGTLLLRNQGLKTMIIVALGAKVLNSWVSGPSGYMYLHTSIHINDGPPTFV